MIGYIYETTNTINKKTYIGQHKSIQFDPNYKGSGILITKALKKYGKDNFHTKIIEWCETSKQLDEREQHHIAEARKTGKCEYNIASGGQHNGGWYWITKQGEYIQVKGNYLDDYIKLGWKLSRTKDIRNKNGVVIHKNSVNRYIHQDELYSYLKEGWELGFDTNYKLASNKGLIWIHNSEGERKMISPEDITNYPDWKLGIGNNSNNGVPEKYINGTIWIHKGSERLRIFKSDKHLYPDWQEGIGEVGPRKEKQMWIHKNNTEKYIYVSERDNYPDWEDGISSARNKGIWINNGIISKYISKSDRSLYTDWEGGQGDCSALKGKFMWIHKGTECKFIPINDRDNFLDWEDGQGKNTRKKSIPTGQYMWINNGVKQTRIRKVDRDKYPNWKNGKIKGSHMWIHNNKESKFIQKVDRDKYPNWKNGHL